MNSENIKFKVVWTHSGSHCTTIKSKLLQINYMMETKQAQLKMVLIIFIRFQGNRPGSPRHFVDKLIPAQIHSGIKQMVDSSFYAGHRS